MSIASSHSEFDILYLTKLTQQNELGKKQITFLTAHHQLVVIPLLLLLVKYYCYLNIIIIYLNNIKFCYWSKLQLRFMSLSDKITSHSQFSKKVQFPFVTNITIFHPGSNEDTNIKNEELQFQRQLPILLVFVRPKKN